MNNKILILYSHCSALEGLAISYQVGKILLIVSIGYRMILQYGPVYGKVSTFHIYSKNEGVFSYATLCLAV